MTTLSTLRKYKAEGKKFSCVTCYDSMFARMMENARIDTILIGDSLGMVVQGHNSTVPVDIDHVVYHTQNVARSNKHALIIADLPFMTYTNVKDAVINARKLMQAGAHVVKLEGGSELCEIITTLTQAGTPTCVHLGLTPQSVNVFGGYKVQGKTEYQAEKLIADAKAVVKAGATLLVLEVIPSDLGKKVTNSVDVPVIGIGAGADTDGQVLVMHDMLGVTHGHVARFVHNFLSDERNESHSIQGAFELFHRSVVEGSYPNIKHTF